MDSRRLATMKAIDVSGAICRYPIAMIKDALEGLPAGALLQVDTDHPATAQDAAPRFCQQWGYPYEVVAKEGYWRLFIEKVVRPGRRPQLAVRHVTKEFATRQGALAVLCDISFDVVDGEFLCLVGPSGCGKSTLLSIIAGLEPADEGEVLVDGRKVIGTGPDRLLIFQDLGLFPWLTVLQNVEFGLAAAGVPARERRRRAMDGVRLVRLEGFQHAGLHQLSGGMRQRVALARAFALNPSVLLMDEPFAALDAQTRDHLHETLQELWLEMKKTIVFVTHNVREAVCLGDRVMVMGMDPGLIQGEFEVRHPRLRHIEDPGLMAIVRQVLSVLKGRGREEVG